MKTLSLLATVCLVSTSLFAQEYLHVNTKVDSQKEYYFSFENSTTVNDIMPTVSFSFKPSLFKRLHCIISYANNFLLLRKPFKEERKIENMYLTLSYRF